MHAEEFRPGGEVLHGDSPDVAVRYAEVFAWLMAELAGVTVAPPLPNPPWVRWDYAGSGCGLQRPEQALLSALQLSGDVLRTQAAERLRRANA